MDRLRVLDSASLPFSGVKVPRSRLPPRPLTHTLSDQLDFEKVLHCKYMAAVQECQDGALKNQFQGLADQHRQNYADLLGYLK